MPSYAVKSTQTNLITLSQSDKTLGTLTYDSWFSFRATIKLSDSLTYTVQPRGFWGTTIDIKAGETVLFDFEMNWNGHIVIHNTADETGSDLVFKQKSILGNTFVLLGQNDDELLLIESDFSWTRTNYDYRFTASATFEHLPDRELVLLLATHCANYYITTMLSTVV